MDLVALSNGLHGSVQMDSVALFSWIGWLRHHGILTKELFGLFDFVSNNEYDPTFIDYVFSKGFVG